MTFPSRRARALALGAAFVLAMAWMVRFGPASQGARPAATAPEGALGELERARRDEALIRAENTALLLRALSAAPTLPGGGS